MEKKIKATIPVCNKSLSNAGKGGKGGVKKKRLSIMTFGGTHNLSPMNNNSINFMQKLKDGRAYNNILLSTPTTNGQTGQLSTKFSATNKKRHSVCQSSNGLYNVSNGTEAVLA